MSVVTEVTIIPDDDSPRVFVRAENKNVVVVWSCGDQFSFSADEARTALGCIDAIADYPNVPLKLPGKNVWVSVRDGILYADTHQDVTSADFVSLDEMRRAVARILKACD